LIWYILAAVLAIWVAIRLGVFSLWVTVDVPTGPVRLVNGLAGVDHPFHAARAATLLRALADGHPLRWIANHQGGYPVEFYPLGVAWLEVTLAAISWNSLPIIAVHKITVVLIFLLPIASFFLLARRDRGPLGVALVAAAIQVALPGDWWHGGYTELVQWGLVTNVAAATATLFVLAWLLDFLETGSVGAAAGASFAAAFAVSTNPRGLLALGVVGVAAWLATISQSRPRSTRPLMATGRLVLVALLSVLLVAPELVSLLRFSDLYLFVRYETYENAAAFLASAIEATSPPLFLIALGGVLVALLLPGRPAARAAAIALVLYSGVTLLFTTQPAVATLVPQLEPTRLMPFQRFLTIYLAASCLGAIATWLGRSRLRPSAPFRGAVSSANPPLTTSNYPTNSPRRARTFSLFRPWLGDGLLLAATLTILIVYVSPTDARMPTPAVDRPQRGLYPVVSTVDLSQHDLELAIRAADAAAPPGTALLVVGSALSWHQQLWAPLWTDRPVFYDDWLWYWHPDHVGPPGYDFAAGHHYPKPALALEATFLQQHGIGAVVATGPTSSAAAAAPTLRPASKGATATYSAYVVREPTTIATLDGVPIRLLEQSGQRLAFGFDGSTNSADDAVVRVNWHPRWRAVVDDRPATVQRTEAGYIKVPIPAGSTRLELIYTVDAMDWAARGAVLVGMAAVVTLLASGGTRLGFGRIGR